MHIRTALYNFGDCKCTLKTMKFRHLSTKPQVRPIVSILSWYDCLLLVAELTFPLLRRKIKENKSKNVWKSDFDADSIGPPVEIPFYFKVHVIYFKPFRLLSLVHSSVWLVIVLIVVPGPPLQLWYTYDR